ncbi:hypothetical protein ACHAWU_002624 [Discostella pseudostelligera]|uniref:EXPERA domain-containing protein n=1 Tax=Discostella pseudostelligera TaxID=259834 RepID=A0ABD3M662_9STRA
MPTLEGTTRTAFLCFFLSHIPITLVIDGQAFFPRRFYPQVLRDVVDWYAITFKDKLMTHPPQPWFTSLVAIEILLQMPFFFVAVYAILQKQKNDTNTLNQNGRSIIEGNGIFRSLCMVYGSSTATSLIPIFASILTDDGTTLREKGILLCFYFPYFIFPLWLVVIAVCEENVFGSKSKKRE